jgi:hypothetical protein
MTFSVIRMLPGVLSVVALVVTGCSDDDPACCAPPPGELVTQRAAVFSPDDLRGDHAPEADWTPTEEQVLAVEELLAAELAAARAEQPELDRIGAYYRQYTGIDGDVVLVNASCDDFDGDWREHWLLVDDGGACFWQATVEDREVTSLRVNGNA